MDLANFRWAFPTGGEVHSSPALGAGGEIYFGVGYTTSPSSGRVFALERTGAIRRGWPVTLPAYVSSSPAVAPDGTIYVGCEDGKLYALTAGGAIKGSYDALAFIASSPAIGPDGAVYFGGGDFAMHALNPDLTLRWRFQTGNWVDSSPAVGVDGTVYFGSLDKSVYAIDSAGRKRWSLITGGEVRSSPALGADGTVYIGSDDGKLYAIGPDGVPRWTFATNAAIEASPVIGPDGTIYVGSDDRRFYAIEPDGRLRWFIGAGKAITSSAAVAADGTVIFGSDDGVIRAVFADTGTSKWARKTDDLIEGSPVIGADGSVYVGSIDGKLYAFGSTGAPLSAVGNWPMFRGNAAHAAAAPADRGRLINLATRAQAGGGANLIMGLVIDGTAPRSFLIRGVGPGLSDYGVGLPLHDPALTLRADPPRALALTNDNWGAEGDATEIVDAAAAVGAFPLQRGSKDSALLVKLEAGLYSAAVETVGDDAGVALVEAYEAGATADARLINLSTLGRAGAGEDALIGGLVIGGEGTLRVLVRAAGPALDQFGVGGTVRQPKLEIFEGDTVFLANTGWSAGKSTADLVAAAKRLGAFPFAEGSADCAALVTLKAGVAYTLKVTGVGGTSGAALVEVYALR
ncbi:MAG: hypothetical protein RLZZ15_1135 [Verrucomicrobiota bacterium]